MRTSVAAAILLFASGTTMQAAPRQVDPDWPCQQVKVSELSVVSFWSGPQIDAGEKSWQHDAAVSGLVAILTQRRLPLEQAGPRIKAFAQAAGSEKQKSLLVLFAGVFDVLNAERSAVLSGLDRFGQRQKALAETLRQDGEALRAAQSATPSDEAKISELTQRFLWDQQVFESRRQSLRFACDVPTIIEQRLYGLSKAIQESLD